MAYAAMLAVFGLSAYAWAAVHHASSGGISYIEEAWSTHVLDQSFPAQAKLAYNTPASFGTGRILDGFATTPITRFTSYATFAAQVGSVSTRWVDYDDESWSQTPAAERADPARYLRLFTQLAHAHGLKVLETPARDLASTDTSCRAGGLDANHWYIKCGIAAAAAGANILDVQDQANMGSPSTYGWFYTAAAAQAHAANPGVMVIPQVSDAHGSPSLGASDVQSVHPPGLFVHVANADVRWEAQLIDDLHAAGIS